MDQNIHSTTATSAVVELRQYTLKPGRRDTLITLDSHETLLLKNVIATNLHSSDFIISPHVA